jgi:hypothetical protein
MLAPNKLKAMTLCKEGQTNYSIGRASRRTVEMSKVKDYKGLQLYIKVIHILVLLIST